jgi:hypothetical protein
MRTVPRERRTRRSGKADEALLFQLDHVRSEAGLDAIVLATAEGLPVAHSGEDELCEELAALAPFMHVDADPGGIAARGKKRARATHGSEYADKARRTRVRSMTFTDVPLLLVSYRRDSPVENDGWLEHASKGIARILSA